MIDYKKELPINTKLTVGRMWYQKGREAYFGLKHLTESFPNIEFDIHLIINDYDYIDEYTNKIDDLNLNITFYKKDFFKEYLQKHYLLTKENVDNIINLPHFYHMVIGHYLRRVHLIDYMLTYEYDVVFKDTNLKELEHCLENKIPFGINEPHNIGCDKGLYQSLSTLFQTDLRQENISLVNPEFLGINAGFQGINLGLFDEFLSVSSFTTLLSIFDFKPLINEDGTKRLEGWNQTMYETQEQSFYSLLNQTYSKNYTILNPQEYYFWPCWDENPEFVEKSLQSKVLHFTGHKKSKEWYKFMDEFLNKK
ncbi:hypothetical protein UFOVP331_93 [uncultured Caudovirales phage]|uniref:Uncharacterized protein n=1 Tax=uncultured Caudovirales phage TaxID=2100421 RepID=A0A6J5LZ99_9CAUD|nr:hypothetical protein UFOVP331_93 [uncultured Caudovirales phage]